MRHQTCPKCDYSWRPRVDKPKACPRCKNRMDAKQAGKRILRSHS